MNKNVFPVSGNPNIIKELSVPFRAKEVSNFIFRAENLKGYGKDGIAKE